MYKKVEWISKYNIGIDSIDAQHKSLFELANKFFAQKEDNSKDEFKKLVYEFNKYLAEHFRDEEEFMESIDYPDAQVHKELHEKIIKRGTDVLKNASSVAQMKSEMKKVSKDFFIEHILKHDMKIKYFYDKPENENIQEISGIS